jgi:hypothetical protein
MPYMLYFGQAFKSVEDCWLLCVSNKIERLHNSLRPVDVLLAILEVMTATI